MGLHLLAGHRFEVAIYEGNVLGLVGSKQYFCFLACMHVAYLQFAKSSTIYSDVVLVLRLGTRLLLP